MINECIYVFLVYKIFKRYLIGVLLKIVSILGIFDFSNEVLNWWMNLGNLLNGSVIEIWF